MPANRRVLTWILLAAVLLGAGLVATLYRRASDAVDGFTGSAPPRVSQQVVVERLEAVAKLVSSEMTLRDVVIYEQTRFGSTKKALLVVTGRVAAGINLKNGAKVDIDSVAHRIRITLPTAQVLSVDVLNVTTYDERAGLLNPFRPEDRDAIQLKVRHRLIDAARESGILAHADRSAQELLVRLLAVDGYVVEIVHPPVQVTPVTD